MCLKPSHALKQLHNLPKSLEGTYTRILQRVPSESEKEMRTILMLLAFSARPVTIQEVAEATAVDLELQKFSKEERFPDPYDILELCSSLVSLSEPGIDTAFRPGVRSQLYWNEEIKILQFAHFSVKEFLLSDLSMQSIPRTLYFNASMSQRYLTELCLIYLLDFNDGERANNIDHNGYPFLDYAALHWSTHLIPVGEHHRGEISKLLIRLLDRDHPGSLMNCLNVHNPTSHWNTFRFDTQYRNTHDFETPLYYACYYGLRPVVDALLGRNPHSYSAEELGSALEAASLGGHDEIIKLLLAKGSDPNAKYCSQFYRPIQAAAHSGKSSTVNLLIAAGADISSSSYGGEGATALHVAAKRGSVEGIQALLNAGHEINYISYKTSHLGTALAVAASNGNDEAVGCLLCNGADPNLYGYRYAYPLTLACENCRLESVKMIVEAGADVDGVGRDTPLHVAANRGELSIMKLLVEHGADINMAGGVYGTPLKAAIQSRGEDPAVFKFMLNHGADINAKGSSNDYPVDQAIFGGNLDAADGLLEMGAMFSEMALANALDHSEKEYLVERLLKRGADPNAEYDGQGNMLQLAINNGCSEQTIRLLLEAGASVNRVEGENGTALQAAVISGEEDIVRLLFHYGAIVNPPTCGEYGNPLQAAVACEEESIIQLLLEKGANVHSVGGRYGSILQAAAATGNEPLVRLLLSKGVDINTVGGEFGTALRASIAMEFESITKLLLDAGADINVEVTASHTTKADRVSVTEFKSVLQVATASCNLSFLQLLLDHGMVLSPEYLEDTLVQAVKGNNQENKLKIDFLVSKGADMKMYGGRALRDACDWNGPIAIVHKLLSLGAPVNWAIEGYLGSALMTAVKRGDGEIIQALLDAGADVNLVSGDNGTALIQAIEMGNKGLAIKILESGANLNIRAGWWGTALMKAVQKGDEEMFYELLRRGADVNLTHGYFGTALQTAISSNYYHLAHELLDRGADPTAPGVYASPLICASGYGKAGQEGILKRLISLQVDLETFDVPRPEDNGNRSLFNALQNAARAGNETTAKLLLDAGANVNSVGGTYGTALQAAVKQGHDGILKLLLERGANVNLVGGEFGTALQAAAAEANLQFVVLLLEKGADVNLEGGKYGTALQAACTTSNGQIMGELLTRGAKVNTSCGQYGNPLQAAVHRGNMGNIKVVIEHGAEVDLAGGQYGLELLVQHGAKED